MSLFAAGISLATDNTGALVVLEKIPRKTGRKRDAWYDGEREDEEVFECVFRIVGAEHLTGALPEMVQNVCARLLDEPMLDDTAVRLDVGAVGRAALSLFHVRSVYPLAVDVRAEKDNTDARGTLMIPVATLQAAATLMFETARVEAVSSLVEGPSVMHALGKLDALPTTGPARELGIAAAIALHAALNTGGGAWPSNKPIPKDPETEWARAAKQSALKAAKASAARNRRGGW